MIKMEQDRESVCLTYSRRNKNYIGKIRVISFANIISYREAYLPVLQYLQVLLDTCKANTISKFFNFMANISFF